MNKKLISILIANLFIAAPVVAQDTFKLEGSVSLGGVSVDDGDAVDTAKLNQFRDLSDGGLLGFDLRGRSARSTCSSWGLAAAGAMRRSVSIMAPGGFLQTCADSTLRLLRSSGRRRPIGRGQAPWLGKVRDPRARTPARYCRLPHPAARSGLR